MQSPLISTIITCFNRENFLGEAIDSALSQTFTDHEIIVIDDGSTDGSAPIARRYGGTLRYHFQENQGASAAKNAGVALARGKYLAFLDSDDHWSADKLALQLAYARKSADIAILYGHGIQYLSPELSESERARLHCPQEPMPAPISGTLFLTRETFRQVGEFRTDLSVGIDIEWYLRARSLGLSMCTLPDVLLYRRIHKTNSGFSEKHHQKQHAGILKEHLDRMRRRKREVEE